MCRLTRKRGGGGYGHWGEKGIGLTKKKKKKKQKAITFFNNVSFWAAGAVLLEEGEARREKLAFVIKVMDLCMMCKNYNTAFSVLLGLKLRAVSQLPGLFDSLGEQTQARFQAVSNLFSYHGSYKNYRGFFI